MAHLKLRNVEKKFGALKVIHGVSFDVEDREFVVIVGPSGCGKSTLLRMIAGLEEISAGEVQIDGRRMNEVPASKREIAMVFQSYALYPNMTVYENLAFSLKLAGMPKEEIRRKVARTAEILQIGELLNRRPGVMSGGQRQRVAIGRAIVRNPKVFLFDEPLSNLDAKLRVHTRVEISQLHKDLKSTIIYVTHDQIEAMTMADKIVVMNGGRVEQVGTPLELYNHPANLFVAGFIGSPSMNFFTVRDADQGVLTLDGGETIRLGGARARLADHVRTVGIRPEHLHLASRGAANVLTGEISILEKLGAVTQVYLRGSAGGFLVQLPGQWTFDEDARLSVEAAEEHLHLFDENGAAIAPAEEPAGRASLPKQAVVAQSVGG